MSNDMVVNDELDLPISSIPRAQLAKMSERAYLPFIKLCSTDEDISKFKNPGTWLLCKDATTKQDITSSIEFLIVASRALACHTTTVGIDRFYDINSEDYKEVERLSNIPNRTGDWHGTDFLMYLRAQRQWVTWHAASETHRQRAEVLTDILFKWEDAKAAKKAEIAKAVAAFGADSEQAKAAREIIIPAPQAKMGSELVFYKRYNSKKWAAVISPVTTPFAEYPPFEDIRDRVLKFINPPKQEKEELDTKGSTPSSTRG